MRCLVIWHIVAHAGCTHIHRDASWGCDTLWYMGPCQYDAALVSDSLQAAWLVSNGPKDMSEVQTHHLVSGMVMEMSYGIEGHCRILMMAAWSWRPCLTCSSWGCMWGTHSTCDWLYITWMPAESGHWDGPKDVPWAVVMFLQQQCSHEAT